MQSTLCYDFSMFSFPFTFFYKSVTNFRNCFNIVFDVDDFRWVFVLIVVSLLTFTSVKCPSDATLPQQLNWLSIYPKSKIDFEKKYYFATTPVPNNSFILKQTFYVADFFLNFDKWARQAPATHLILSNFFKL